MPIGMEQLDKKSVSNVFAENDYVRNVQELQEASRANVITQMIHSGVLQHNSITDNKESAKDGALYVDNESINKISLKEFEVNINGNIIRVEGTDNDWLDVYLNEPPTKDFISATGDKGVREDLIFLEVWRQTEDMVIEGREVQNKDNNVWRWSIRVANNVHPDKNILDTNNIFARGMLEMESNVNFNIDPNDKGLFVANGDDLSYDNKVFAIPLLRVKRRNKGNYTVDNSNGSANFNSGWMITPVKELNIKEVGKFNLIGGNIDTLSIGDKLSLNNDTIITITDINATLNNMMALVDDRVTVDVYECTIKTRRPDGKYSNIIYKDDITDLRHKVTLNAPDYRRLLDKNFDRLVRGELMTKQPHKLKKVYIGMEDAQSYPNSVFFASYKDDVTAEVGGEPITLGKHSNNYSPIGNGLVVDERLVYNFSEELDAGLLTMECMIDINNIDIEDYFLIRTEGDVKFSIGINDRYFTGNGIDVKKGVYHIRLVVDGVKRTIYINGNMVKEEIDINYTSSTLTGISIENTSENTIFNVSVVNGDLGEQFPMLPKDFTDGHADLSCALDNQIKIFSDPISTQYTTDIVSSDGTNVNYVNVTQSQEGIWSNGDSIEVSAKNDKDIISGVINSDSAIAKVISYADGEISSDYTSDPSKLVINSHSKVNIGDEITFTKIHEPYENLDGPYTITDITDENVITISIPKKSSNISQYTIIDKISNSDIPVIKFKDSNDNLVELTGMWSGIGTSKIKFTIMDTELDNIVDEDLEVQYSLTIKSGRGQIPVFNDVVSGEYNGIELVKKDSIIVSDDFNRKIVSDLSECPHKAMRYNQSILSPHLYTDEFNQYNYNNIAKENNTLSLSDSLLDSSYGQHIFEFDIIRLVESKYGTINSIDKLQWIRNNVININFMWKGYGHYNDIDKCTLRYSRNGEWSTDTYSHENNYNTEIDILVLNDIDELIDDNGMVHLLAHSPQTDGSFLSTIYTDYVSISIEIDSRLYTNNNYTILAPKNENSRIDTNGGILFVRNETRNVTRLNIGSVDNNSRVVIWGMNDEGQDEFSFTDLEKVRVEGERGIFLDYSNAVVTNSGTGGLPNLDNPDYDYKYKTILNNFNLALFNKFKKFNMSDYDNKPLEYNNVVNSYSITDNMTIKPVRFVSEHQGTDNKYYGDFLKNGVVPTLYYENMNINQNTVFIFYCLVSIEDELYLKTISYLNDSSFNGLSNGKDEVYNYFRLQGRPLIKECD